MAACHLTIAFADGERLEFELHEADVARFSADAAHQWLGEEFEAAGCVPSNPMGKLLAADKVVGLAKAQPRRVFESPTAWTRDYLCAVAASLGRPVVTIDLANHTLGY
jgi:hypothetical protein